MSPAGTSERTAEGAALSGEDAGELIVQALILAEHISDLTCADPHITRRNIGIRADVIGQLGHKALAEAHDLALGFALGVEVAAALAAAHRQAGEGVLQGLLEAQELDHRGADARVEPQAALIGADCGVELDTEPTVDLDLALVVNPGHTELDNPLRLYHPVDNTCLNDVRALGDYRLQGLQDLFDGLQKLRLIGIAFADGVIDPLQICTLEI